MSCVILDTSTVDNFFHCSRTNFETNQSSSAIAAKSASPKESSFAKYADRSPIGSAGSAQLHERCAAIVALQRQKNGHNGPLAAAAAAPARQRNNY
ncbi:hypothetical protein Trydic_g18025 [Trypoxylus dichotomus]